MLKNLIILIIVVCVGYLTYQYFTQSQETEDKIGEACINSGGEVRTSLCCKSAGDYPNLCLIGPCGCSPDNSHNVKICDCGEDKCFDGEKCVEFSLE